MSLNSSSTAAGSTTPPRPDEKKVLATNNKESVRHSEHARDTEKGRLALASDAINDDVNAKLANPLAGWTAYELAKDGERFAREHGLEDLIPALRKGAMLAGDPFCFDNTEDFHEDEKVFLREEYTRKWHQPKKLYVVIACCSMAAIVQGQDQSLINGANIFFPDQFGIGGSDRQSTLLLGLVNAAPYFVCATVACWTTDPLNKRFGRKGTILISLVFACLPCLWSAFTNSWQNLFAARCILAFGIGPKSATVPMYAAEMSPAPIRGGLVLMWQMWTAFGIMIGFVCSLMFYNVSSPSIEGLNWRLMLGSGAVPPIIVFIMVFYCPESPRWLMEKDRYRDAYKSLREIRFTDSQAARDLYYIDTLLGIENKIVRKGNRYAELFTIPRNRRATTGAFLVMFMQQFCGVNVIAYYSGRVLVESGLTDLQALLGSWGFGMINWLFAIPGIKLMDSFGRRNLLLSTYPMMSVCLLMTGFAFWIPEGTVRIAVILLGIYLFGVVYSPGCGPVPFTYSAEAFPLYIRPLGMSFATAICWGFNGVLAFTFPLLLAALKPQGAFGFYAGMNWVGFVLVLMLLPETKSLSLEELDQVFSVSTRKHARWGLQQPLFWLRRYIFRQDIQQEQLYDFDSSLTRTYAPAAAGH